MLKKIQIIQGTSQTSPVLWMGGYIKSNFQVTFAWLKSKLLTQRDVYVVFYFRLIKINKLSRLGKPDLVGMLFKKN